MSGSFTGRCLPKALCGHVLRSSRLGLCIHADIGSGWHGRRRGLFTIRDGECLCVKVRLLWLDYCIARTLPVTGACSWTKNRLPDPVWRVKLVTGGQMRGSKQPKAPSKLLDTYIGTRGNTLHIIAFHLYIRLSFGSFVPFLVVC